MIIPRKWASSPLCKRVFESDLSVRVFVAGLLLLVFMAVLPTQVYAAADLKFNKIAGEVVSSGYNTYQVPIRLEVKNTGSTNLRHLQLEDDLDIFRSGNVVAIGQIEVLQGSLSVNPDYNGIDDIALLTGDDSLPVGATAILSFDLTFDPVNHSGPYANKAIVTATKANSNETVTRSAEAKFRLPLHPEIDFKKTAGVVTSHTDGTYSVPITLDISNVGEEEIERLQLKDDLDIFGSGRVVSVDSIEVLSGELELRSGFDGKNEVRLLSGRDTLAVGHSASVRFNVTFDAAGEPGPFTNWAIAWTAGAESDIGIDIGARAYINLPQGRTGISLNKSAGDVRARSDGSLSVPITLRLSNTGDETLENIQLSDNLDILGNGVLLGVENLRSDTLLVNSNFDGLMDQALLLSGNTLTAGSSTTVTFTLRFRPGSDPGPFTNTADVTATGSLTGALVSDSGSTGFLGNPTQSNPAIQIAKAAGPVRDNPDGTSTVPITLTITNVGNEPHSQLQVIDALDFFGTGSLFSIERVVAPQLSVNTNYDGLDDSRLLVGTDTLDLAEQVAISFDLRFDPGDESGPFLNTASATAVSEISGTRVTDTDDVLFPARPPQAVPSIAITKTAGSVSDLGNGNLSVGIELTVTNTGDEPLAGLQIADNLNIFGNGTLVAIENLTASSLSVNALYDGLNDVNLLAGSDSLPVGAAATVSFSMRYDPADEEGPFRNTATATATSETSGTIVTGTDDALFPRTPPQSDPGIAITKTAGTVLETSSGDLSVAFDLTVTNTGDEPLTSVQVVDNLNIFGAGTLASIENLTSDVLTLNPLYNGLNDINLLAGSDVVPVGVTATISFNVLFDPLDEEGPFRNVSTVTATSETSGTLVTGTDDVMFPGAPPQLVPDVTITKTAGTVSTSASGDLAVGIELTITNTGDEPLTSVQVVDNLNIFGAGTLVRVENLTADSLTLNPFYDGLTDVNLLSGNDVLPIGAVATILFDVLFDPADETGPFQNTSTVTATSETSGTIVTGSDDVLFPGSPPQLIPNVAIIKTAGTVVTSVSGDLAVPIELTVTNTGDEALTSIQVEDDLNIFGNGALIGIENLTSSSLTLNPLYDGLTDVNLTSGNDVLPIGAVATISFDVLFDPVDEIGPFQNTSTVTATSETSGSVVSGTDDAEFSAAPPQSAPSISIAKTAGTIADNGDGTFSVDINLTVSNTGDERLGSVQIEDDLNIFETGTLLEVENIASTDFTLNINYDGVSDTLILTGDDTLALNASGTVTFTVRFDPGDESNPFRNVATATATSETSSTPVTGADDVFFPAQPPQVIPGIEIAKTAGVVRENNDGSLSVDIGLTVTNTSVEPLVGLQIEDDLDIFGDGQLLQVESIATNDFALNANYDGLSDVSLLGGDDSLAVGASGTVTFTIRFSSGDEPGPFVNVSTATAVGASTGGLATGTDSATFSAAPPQQNAALSLSKTAGAVVENGDGSLSVPISLTASNLGNEILTALQITDDLDIFGNGQFLAVEDVASNELSINPGYDGISEIALLDGSDSLALGASATVTFVVRFDPGDTIEPFLNVARTNATGDMTGTAVSDSSEASIPGRSARPVPAIEIVKSTGVVADNGDGSLSVPVILTVSNIGIEDLSELQIVDDLDIFETGQLIAVENLLAPGLDVNSAYDGLQDINILNGTDTLPISSSVTVTLTLRFDPGEEDGPFVNTATTNAVSDTTSALVDDSSNAPISTRPTEPFPAIEIEKTVGSVADNGDGSLSVDVSLLVTNIGNEVLNAVQVDDDLEIFGVGQLLAVEDMVASSLTLSGTYDGLADINILEGTDTLVLGESALITFRARFDPASEAGPFLNNARATGTSEISGELVTDSSEASIDRIPTSILPRIAVAKTADKTDVVRGDIIGYDVRITNLTQVVAPDIVITDRPPAGFEFQTGSAVLIRAGADGLLDTFDDIELVIDTTGRQTITSASFNLAPSEVVLFRYLLRVGTGVADGEHMNFVTASTNGTEPGSASFPVNVIGDPIFEKATLIGKVFVDDIENFRHDNGEPGLAGVRIGTVSGLTMETDAEGRFHLADVDVARFERGENFILKLDVTSLPDGYKVVSENPRVERLTQAMMSKINFAVRRVEVPAEFCLQQCVNVTRRQVATQLNSVYFPSGIYEIPPDFATKIRAELQSYEKRQRAQLVFIGHADRDPVVGQLAETLGDEGQAGNDILSERRAREVCEFVKRNLGIETNCENVEGRGSRETVSVDDSEEQKALDRRVEIEIEYLDFTEIQGSQSVEPVMCSGIPNNTDAFTRLFSGDTPNATERICTSFPDETDASDAATARAISVSGGSFGCNFIAAEVLLPGRNYLGGTRADNVVNVFAQDMVDDNLRGYACNDDISIGEYPIEVRTGNDSVLWITSAGDVLRVQDPDNDEHIVVTPFRDDSDSSVVTALRISNEGTEPRPTEENRTSDDIAEPQEQRINDLSRIDPRLDVLAIDDARIDDSGRLQALRFAAYTNYAAFINSYSLEIYGSTPGGFSRKLLYTTPPCQSGEVAASIGAICSIDFNEAISVPANSFDVSRYSTLEYILKVSDCDEMSVRDGCHFDSTKPRILSLLHSGEGLESDCEDVNADIETRDPSCDRERLVKMELWGKTNLANQRIPIQGTRVRTFGIDLLDSQVRRIANATVPVGKDGRYILEQHVRDDVEPQTPKNSALAIVNNLIPADATGLQVSGGAFGCNKEMQDALPGRAFKHDPLPRASIVVADVKRFDMPEISCDDNSHVAVYPIVVTTAEGSEIHITEAGDVLRKRHPAENVNRQRIIVTPFRDDSNNSQVTALRISNEGVEADETKEAWISDSTSTKQENDYNFVVALANISVGKNSLSGNQQLLAGDSHFDGSVFADGRIAFYAKRRVAGSYTLTAQLDSTEDELSNFSDNLRRKDPRRIFRQLDPNQYYSVYGDDSTTTTDVDTQGAMYVRLDWNKNTAIWGNYNTGLTGTEFAQYNRSLYGAKLSHESQKTTSFGDSSTELALFGSEAQSAAAHVTFQATGGSLYYLRDTDIVQGSEKVWIEVRRRDTEQVIETETLLQGRDYEIDAIQGRIILSRPLSQIVAERNTAIIRSTPLEGDNVFLLVDYEYVPVSFTADDVTYGGRGRLWLNDHVGLGVTAVADERSGTDYEMQGFDVTLKANENSYVKAEYASSRARQNNSNFLSLDGGLSFQAQLSPGVGGSLDGDAIGLDARLDLGDFSDNLEGDIRAWLKNRDAGFSTGRLGQGVEIRDRGFETHIRAGNIDVSASYTDLEHELTLREKVARVQAEIKAEKLTAGVEVRYEDVEVQSVLPFSSLSNLNGGAGQGQGLLVGARLAYKMNEANTVYTAAQTVADDSGMYRENDLFTIGINRSINEKFAISVEGSDGDRGSAVTAGVDLATANGLNFNLSGGVGSGAISQFATRYSIAEGHELYGSYTVDPDRTERARNLLTLGQRRSFGNSLALFTESQFGKNDRYANVAHVFGLDFEGVDDWRFSASMQFGENSRQGVDFERRALTLGAILKQEKLRFSSRIEVREDDGVGVRQRQYVSSSSLTKIANDDRRWISQLNLSWTDDELNGGRDAKFVEFELGQALRPTHNDKFNLLAKYSYLFDLPTEGQATSRADERSHLLAIDGLYDFDNRWELGGKVAIRKGERRAMRNTGPWIDFGLRMAAVRARYHWTHEWDGLAEYRWLSDIDGDNSRHGALVGAYRHVGKNMKIGVGFNFTDFNDDLTIDSYQNNGWFLDLVGKY